MEALLALSRNCQRTPAGPFGSVVSEITFFLSANSKELTLLDWCILGHLEGLADKYDVRYGALRSQSLAARKKLWLSFIAETRSKVLWDTLFEFVSERKPLARGRRPTDDVIWDQIIPPIYTMLQKFDAALLVVSKKREW